MLGVNRALVVTALLGALAASGCPIRNRPPPWVAEQHQPAAPDPSPTGPQGAAAPAPATQPAPDDPRAALQELQGEWERLQASPRAAGRDALLAGIERLSVRLEGRLHARQESGDARGVDEIYELLDALAVLRDGAVTLEAED